jgi:hypothetical protein
MRRGRRGDKQRGLKVNAVENTARYLRQLLLVSAQSILLLVVLSPCHVMGASDTGARMQDEGSLAKSLRDAITSPVVESVDDAVGLCDPSRENVTLVELPDDDITTFVGIATKEYTRKEAVSEALQLCKPDIPKAMKNAKPIVACYTQYGDSREYAIEFAVMYVCTGSTVASGNTFSATLVATVLASDAESGFGLEVLDVAQVA